MGFYDVIIAGAGPAGATAGYILGKLGYRVLLIDKARFPRPKVCAGALTYKTHKLIMRIFELTPEEIQELVGVSSNAFEVYYKDKKILNGEFKRPFYFVDRRMYDNFFVKKARTCGVEVIEKDRIVDYNPYTNEVTLSSTKKFKGRYIIGADGVNSIIRKRLPVYKAEKWKKSLALGMEVYVDRQLVKKPRMYLGYINPGYGWVFPGKNSTVVGLGGILRNKHHFAERFKRFLNHLNLRAEGVVGHLIPYGNFMKKPVYKETLLAGDAAGFVDPLFGEGIFFAHRSGEIAAFSIHYSFLKNNRNTLEDIYLSLLHKYIFTPLIQGKILRNTIFANPAIFAYLPFRFILKLIQSRLLEMFHGEKLLGLKKWQYCCEPVEF